MELNGLRIPNSDRNFVLNWASRDNDADSYSREGPVYSLYVGNLGPDVDGPMLGALFRTGFPSYKGATLGMNHGMGNFRGFGFVRFGKRQDQQKALVKMQGVYCGNRPMRLFLGRPKR